MSEFWKRKMRKYFSTIDFDNDGVVSKEDFVGMGERYATFVKPEKQNTERIKTSFENVWEQFLKKAENGDRNTLTAEELIVSIGKQRYDPELMKLMEDMMSVLHDTLDVNRDGYLQEDEHQRMLFQVGIGEPDPSLAKKAFKAIDINGDGVLSFGEFTNAFMDFFFSDDEKSPNASILGPLDD